MGGQGRTSGREHAGRRGKAAAWAVEARRGSISHTHTHTLAFLGRRQAGPQTAGVGGARGAGGAEELAQEQVRRGQGPEEKIRRVSDVVLPSAARREHQPQAQQRRTCHLTRSTSRRERNTMKVMSNVVPPDDAEEAQEEEQHHECDVQRCATG
eukprot:8155622-Pyramimonas_sp.AAC.1